MFIRIETDWSNNCGAEKKVTPKFHIEAEDLTDLCGFPRKVEGFIEV